MTYLIQSALICLVFILSSQVHATGYSAFIDSYETAEDVSVPAPEQQDFIRAVIKRQVNVFGANSYKMILETPLDEEVVLIAKQDPLSQGAKIYVPGMAAPIAELNEDPLLSEKNPGYWCFSLNLSNENQTLLFSCIDVPSGSKPWRHLVKLPSSDLSLRNMWELKNHGDLLDLIAGRPKVKSVKSVVLMSDEQTIPPAYLQFGRLLEKNTFFLDYKNPFSKLKAFGYALSVLLRN